MGVTDKPRDTIGFEDLDLKLIRDLFHFFKHELTEHHSITRRELIEVFRRKGWGEKKVRTTADILARMDLITKRRYKGNWSWLRENEKLPNWSVNYRWSPGADRLYKLLLGYFGKKYSEPLLSYIINEVRKSEKQPEISLDNDIIKQGSGSVG